MKEKLLGVVQAVLTAFVIVSGAIALPILFRPFFYWHIKPMNLTDMVGLTPEQIKTAYNEMMNYCTGISDTFSAGVLPFSDSGADHFADVRKLFLLDLGVLLVAVLLLAGILILKRKRIFWIAGHTSGFWSAIGLGVTFAGVGFLAALDFDRAFVVFHELFFPGKDNWIFDSRFDPIINMLPEEFFRNCALLILSAILLSCGALILWDIHKRKTALLIKGSAIFMLHTSGKASSTHATSWLSVALRLGSR